MQIADGQCKSCGRSLKRMDALYCSLKCTRDDQQRYSGESIEEAKERVRNSKKRLRKLKLSIKIR